MKRALCSTIASVSLFFVLAAVVDAQEKIELKLNLKQGQVFRVLVTTDQKIKQTINEREVEMDQSMGFGCRFEVKEVDEKGDHVIKLTYESISFKQESQGYKVGYESTKPPGKVPPAMRGYAAMVGQGFTFKVSPQGSVKEVQDVDKMIAKMVEEMKKMLAEMGEAEGPTAQLEDALKKQFSDEKVKMNMENMFAVYPDKPVAVGDKWSKKKPVTMIFAMMVENTWTLAGIKDGIASVDVSSDITDNPEEPALELGMVKIRASLKGKQKGNLQIDTATGWTVRGSFSQELSGDLETADRKMPISIASTITAEPIEEAKVEGGPEARE